MSRNPRKALFSSASYALTPGGGGVQRCTREYLEVARLAGFEVELLPYDVDQSLSTKVRRRLFGRPYHDFLPKRAADDCLRALEASDAGWLFLNQVEPGPLAVALAGRLPPDVRVAMLSHGLDSSDFVHYARFQAEQKGRNPGSVRESWWLGRQLFEEMRHHRAFDVTFCLSETDLWIARWLGARDVVLLPRAVDFAPLEWSPVDGRVGHVATLVHAPNLEGLILLCGEIARQGAGELRLRLIGSPREKGAWLATQYPFIDYLGPLSDEEMAREAATWCCFTNPIFCYARGCSTKLAVPLGWRLPVTSSRAGARGYRWEEELSPLCDTPAELARETLRLSDLREATAARPLCSRLADASPDMASVAERFRDALERADRRGRG